MTLFDRDQFNELAQKEANIYVSIYTPSERQSTDGYQSSRIHFKNALTEAKSKLITDFELTESQAEEFLVDGFNVLDDLEFWKYSSDMVAFLVYDGQATFLKLPLTIENTICQVGIRPYLLPLIPELNDDGHFYLLALNLKEVQLFEVTRSTIQQITLSDDIATSYTEEIEDADRQKALQHRSGLGQAGAMFHGQGSGSDEDRKVEILQYYHRLSAGLDPLLHKNPLPLLLAGVEYLIPLYREASKYPYIVESYLTGSYTEDDMLTLSAEAWELMEPYFLQERKARKEEYGLFMSRAQGDSDTESVLLTALSGGVDTLFIQNGQEVWGTYEAESFRIRIDEAPNTDNYSLLNEAAKKTKEFGGKVYLLDAESMPAEGAIIAGIFRYPIAEVVPNEEASVQ